VVERFGLEVGELVAALTDDPEITNWVARKNALRAQVEEAGPRATVVYAADKLANLGEMRRLYDERGDSAIDLHKAPTLDLRIEAWAHDVEMLERVAPQNQLLPALRQELAAFEAERMKGIVRRQEAGARG
jgi:hypothetical protein